MKVRCGFVTNSSSSSFIIRIIGGHPANIEELYSDIRKMYIDMVKKASEVLELGVQWGIVKQGDGIKDLYDILNDAYWKADNTCKAVNFAYEVDRLYGFDWYDILGYTEEDFPWLKYDTYKEYIASFKNPGDAPFILVDHREKLDENEHLVREAVYWYSTKDESEFSYHECRVALDESKDNIWKYGIKLGEFGIYSDCGKIPEYIVEGLYSLSYYSCNHMG